jgi:carbamoyl-phosphate synthase small subunit
MQAMLALEDGTVWEGEGFGAEGECPGQVVFNTGMTGYQEILTDPSYRGQIVVMTYPLIGNYGVNPDDIESAVPQVEGFVVREYCPFPSNWRKTESLGDLLKRHNIIAMEGIDTRALTKRIRVYGVMKGIISTVDLDPASLIEKARSSPDLSGRDLVKIVTCHAPHKWHEGTFDPITGTIRSSSDNNRWNVVAYDFGIKHNILRQLIDANCCVTIVPASTTVEDILRLHPDGIFLSNGPGDPEDVPYAIKAIAELIETGKPIFGICLGQELIGLALGGRTYKMKFGHRGVNQPVKNLETGHVEITSHNHGFAVDPDSLHSSDIEMTHISLNDDTLEGFRHRHLPVFAVQYHPEASPGPHDSHYLFHQFVKLMESHR